MLLILTVFLSRNGFVEAIETTVNCRSPSNYIRQDGGNCFEIPSWQHQPVELESHLETLKKRLGNLTRRHLNMPHLEMSNSDISRYMDTVLAPFLDTYHRNIQNSYQQLTGKILRRIKDEINSAVQKKNKIYTELTELADTLNVPEMCLEERRLSRTLANKHVALIYACAEEARSSIAKMGKYAEEMITITRNYMQSTLQNILRVYGLENRKAMSQSDVNTCIKDLSRASVTLGYELDLCLTNARRYNEQSCERLTGCTTKAHKYSDDTVEGLKESLYQCVYA